MNMEQNKALKTGLSLYQEYCSAWSDPECDARMEMLEEAFDTLGDYVDEVDDVYYRAIFANVVQDMQDCGKFELSPECIETKNTIYLETLKWFQNAQSVVVGYKPFLICVFHKLGENLLSGAEGLMKNDNVAWICYRNAKLLGSSVSDLILEAFVQDEEGKWAFVGERPG